MKTCSKCKIEKPFEDFYKRKSTKDGLRSQCKVCEKAYARSEAGRASAARSNAKPETKARKLAWKKTEKGREAEARYERSQAGRAKNSRYRNSDKGKATWQAYYAKHADEYKLRAKEHGVVRRAWKHDTTSDDWKSSEVFNSANWRCFYCGVDVEVRRERWVSQPNEAQADHFIPLSRGGTNERRNIVCSCGQCNLSKNSKNPFDFIRDNINQQTEE